MYAQPMPRLRSLRVSPFPGKALMLVALVSLSVFPFPLSSRRAVCAEPASRSNSSPNKFEWLLSQKHHSTGDIQTTFTSDAVKIHKKNLGYYLVAKAPDWDVFVFRNDDKVICKLTKKAYYGEQGFNLNAPLVSTQPMVGDEYIWSVKTNIYRGMYHDDWIGKFPEVSQNVFDMIMSSTFYKSPPADGIVLKSVKLPKAKPRRKEAALMLNLENSSGVRLETMRLRKVPYKASDFSVPTNYRVAKLRSVITSVDSRTEADSIIMQMGLGEKLGK